MSRIDTYRRFAPFLFATLLAIPSLVLDAHRILDHWHEAPTCPAWGEGDHFHDDSLTQESCWLCALPSLSFFDDPVTAVRPAPLAAWSLQAWEILPFPGRATFGPNSGRSPPAARA